MNIRNFAIIAHVDHGKSTLADRLLEITKTVPKEKMAEQFLDQNPISRRRGITIKLAPVRMKFTFNSQLFTLNLIDTPGHVDFSYEVSRTLAACDGAILLVDATQGIQAQTVAHFRTAKKQGLVLIPVINKIDLPNAQIEIVSKELVDVFGFKKQDLLHISAKTGKNVGNLLEAIIKRFPAPRGKEDKTLRGLIFDAVYDEFRGVVAYVRIVDGKIKKGDKVRFYQNNIESEVTDLGYFSPHLVSSNELSTGEIGYVITGVKDIRKVRVGDTITTFNSLASRRSGQLSRPTSPASELAGGRATLNFDPLPGYKIPKAMVFFGVYPKSTNDYIDLKESLAKLTLNDTALTYTEEYSSYLGSGFRVGFLGLLHAQIVKERIKQEFNLEILLTMPQVLYDKKPDGTILEPYMKLIVYSPKDYVGPIMNICQTRKGNLLDLNYHESYAVLSYDMPFSMFIRGISSDLKSASEGYASLDYELTSYKKADLAEIELKVNDVVIDVLTELAYKDEAIHIARQKAERLKNSLPRQQFRQIIQGVVDHNIVSREEIPPFRKDVLSRMSGGDRRRKDKLLEAQKKGKSRMISAAKINIPQEALLSMIEENN